jgi:hypothetical protein
MQSVIDLGPAQTDVPETLNTSGESATCLQGCLTSEPTSCWGALILEAVKEE